MSASETPPSSRGRGRPRAEHPLSNAERQRRYRERQKNAEKQENPQTLQRVTQLQERIDRLESRQLEQFSRMEKRQSELEHRLKSMQTLLTRLVQRLDIAPPGTHSGSSARMSGGKAAGSRRKVDPMAAFAEESRQLSAAVFSAPDDAALSDGVPESTDGVASPVLPDNESREGAIPYYVNAGRRCQIATGRDAGQCSGTMSHTITLALPDGSLGTFAVCQIHFRQALQQRTLTPCLPEKPET
jgi:TolA-binding protein